MKALITMLGLLLPANVAQSTPSLVIDVGAGVSPYAKLLSGSTDTAGWVVVATGSDVPIDRRGIVTVVFGTPRSEPTSVCLKPLNEAAKQLHAPDFFPSQRNLFIIYSPEYNPNRAQLAPYTTYFWRYEVGESCIKGIQD